MSYYPILSAPGCSGWATLCNYAPNNWEVRSTAEKYINLTWAEGDNWRSEVIGRIKENEMRTVTMGEVSGMVPTGSLPLVSLTIKTHPAYSSELPISSNERTNVPAWRATLGLSSSKSTTCYQGEIDPFPAPGSILTFCPFLQFGNEIENFLILLNIERRPVERHSEVQIYDSADPSHLKGSFDVRNNYATVIGFDGLGFRPTQLPLIICKGMSAIPLYFSRTRDGSCLSLEHTHPPASFVIHGKRWDAQKLMKNVWFTRTSR